MKQFFLLLFVSIAFLAKSQDNSYQIVINGQPFDVSLNKSFTYVTPQGEAVEFVINQTKTAQAASYKVEPKFEVRETGNSKTYQDELVQFTYSANESLAVTRPRKDFQQITIVSGMGSGVIIQEFLDDDPAQFATNYVNQLIGGQSNQVSQTVAGRSLLGNYGVDSDGNRVVVYTYGNNGRGIILTLIGKPGSEGYLSNFLEHLQFSY